MLWSCTPSSTTDLIRYLAGLTVSQGRLAGQAFRVLPWQRRFVRGAFAPGTQSAALSVARGNGKTALLSGIACATLDGPLMVPRAGVCPADRAREQRVRLGLVYHRTSGRDRVAKAKAASSSISGSGTGSADAPRNDSVKSIVSGIMGE